MTEEEIWKDIPGYEGMYQVSTFGNVRSLDRIVYKNDVPWNYKGRVLKQHPRGNGRLIVNLCNKDKKIKSKEVHRLVMLTFVGEIPENYETCHADGNYLNNNIYNLSYDTKQQNHIDRYRQGLLSGSGVLSIKEVLQIRVLFENRIYTQMELVNIYNVSRSTIQNITSRKKFYWLNDDGTIEESKTKIKYTR